MCSTTTQVTQVAAYTTQIRPSQLKRQQWETQPIVEVLKPPLLPPPKKTKKIHPPFTWGPSIWERVTKLAGTHEITQGKVISANQGGVVVKITSIGYKGNVKAFVPNSHLPSSSESTGSNTELIGTVLPIKIVSITTNNNTPKQHSSLPRVVATIPAPSIWERVTYIHATNEITQGKVISVNKGGMIVKMTSDGYKGTVNAFLPNSYLASSSSTSTTTTTSSTKKKELIGRVLLIQVVSITDTHKHAFPQVVVSHKSAVALTQQQLALTLQLKTTVDRDHNKNIDLVTDGIVTAIQSAGAVISFQNGQQQGLLHKKHISSHGWKLVPTPTNDGYIIDACFRDEEQCDGETHDVLLKVGSRVKCLILNSNSNSKSKNNNKEDDDDDENTSLISLSTEALEPEAGAMLCDPERVFAKAEETLASKFYASHILR